MNMVIQSNGSLQFTFQFYFYVNYLGPCHALNDSRMYDPSYELPVPIHHIHLMILEVIALILNGTSLFLFVFAESNSNLCLAKSNTFQQTYQRVGTTSYSRTGVSIHASQPRRYNHNTKKSFRRSSFVTGLLMLCICEVVFSLSSLLFTLLLVIFPYNVIHQTNLPSNHIPPSSFLLIMPVVENFIFFILDVSLMCRNWCVCLITCARAEIVIWPLGSKSWQCMLRRPRRFVTALGMVFLVALVISFVRHADYIGLLCYDYASRSYALWPTDFLLSDRQLPLYQSAVVLPFQSLIPWVLIVICTILIIFKLKPWKKETRTLRFKHSKSIDDMPSKGEHSQQDAIRKRQEGQTRATFVVLTVALVFGVLEFMHFFTIICEIVGVINDMKLLRKLETIGNTLIIIDSICNFLIFISMMAYFRDLFMQLCCYCKSTEKEDSNGPGQY